MQSIGGSIREKWSSLEMAFNESGVMAPLRIPLPKLAIQTSP